MKGRDIGAAGGQALGTYFGGTVGGALGSIAGSALGGLFDSDDQEAAEEAWRRAQVEIERVGAPPEQAQEILLRSYNQVGLLTPEVEQAIQLEAPKVSQIKEAPELRKAQMTALQALGQRATTGRSAEDRAALAQLQLQQARDTEAKRQQILQSYQQRGMGGAGGELAAQLQAASAGSAQAGEQGVQLAAQAQRAALEAAREYGALGGQIRGQEFDIARTKAGAEDQASVARFNEAVARQQRNVATQMGAQRYNLGTAQQIAQANVLQANEELRRQREAQTSDWQNKLRYAQARSGMYSDQAQRAQQRSAQESARSAQMGIGLGQALSGVNWGGVKNWFGSGAASPSGEDLFSYSNPQGGGTYAPEDPFSYSNPNRKPS